MGRTHKEQLELAKEIEEAKAKITVGAEYWHHKSRDKVYKVIRLGFLEANEDDEAIWSELKKELANT